MILHRQAQEMIIPLQDKQLNIDAGTVSKHHGLEVGELYLRKEEIRESIPPEPPPGPGV